MDFSSDLSGWKANEHSYKNVTRLNKQNKGHSLRPISNVTVHFFDTDSVLKKIISNIISLFWTQGSTQKLCGIKKSSTKKVEQHFQRKKV